MKDRNWIYRELDKIGVAKAIVCFDGGNDDGGVQSIDYFDATGNKVKEIGFDESWEDHRSSSTLEKELTKPIYDKYHTFCGDFYVSGTLTYDVCERKNFWNEDYEEGDPEDY